MTNKKKEPKIVKSYSLPPVQVAWLREKAAAETTPEKTISASDVLTRIIDLAMSNSAKQLPLIPPTPPQFKQKKSALALEPLVA